MGVLATFFASSASAQTEELRSWRADTLGWKFTAIYGEDRLVGFLAIASPGTATGDNIRAILYERRLDGSWSSRGWIEGDADSAYGYTRSLFGLSDSWADGQGVGAEEYAPEDMFFGLPEGDPLLELVATDPNPGELVGLIADAGLPAAPALSTIQANDITGQAVEGAEAGSVAVLAETDLLDSLGHNAEEFAFGSSSIGIGGGICAGCAIASTKTYASWNFVALVSDGDRWYCQYTRTITKNCFFMGFEIFGCGRCTANNYSCTATQDGWCISAIEDPCPMTVSIPDIVFPEPDPCVCY